MEPNSLVALILASGVMALTFLALGLAARDLGRRRWTPSSPTVDPQLLARLQALTTERRLRLEPYGDRWEGGTWLVVEGVCDKLSLRRESPEGRAPGELLVFRGREDMSPPPPRAPDLDTEDEEFDQLFLVLGPPPLAHAILGAATRRALRTLLQGPLGVAEVSVGHGELRVLLAGWSAVPAERWEPVARAALEVAHRLVTPADVPGQLAQNAREDPLPRVRLRQLVTLLREYPDHPVSRELLGFAAMDADPEVRLRAGIALGEEGVAVLMTLAGDGTVDDSCASRAIDALAGRLQPELAATVLARALDPREAHGPLVARSCLVALALGRRPEGVPILRKVLLSQGGALAIEAAGALADIGLSAAEPPLIEGLQARDAETRLASAKALARVGSAAAVAPLEDAAERLGRPFSRTAREAVAEIQGRLVGAEPGQVSLAQDVAGQVSLAEDPAGRVSLGGSKPGSSSREP